MNARADPPRPDEDMNPRPQALRLIQFIGGGTALAAAASPASLGFKAWNLARMAALGLPVPPAFVLGTGWCEACAAGRAVGPELWQEALAELERFTGLALGDTRRPLLLSVRSGAPVSMPGMMSTVLNIGLSDTTLPGLVRLTGHPRLAWDAYRRLVACFGEVVAGVDAQHFEADLDAVRGGRDERELDFAALREVANRHLVTYARQVGEAQPVVTARLEDAVDPGDAQPRDAEQQVPVGAVDVDRETRAVLQRPGELGIEPQIELAALPAGDDLGHVELVEADQPVGLVEPVLAEQWRRRQRQLRAGVGDRREG